MLRVQQLREQPVDFDRWRVSSIFMNTGMERVVGIQKPVDSMGGIYEVREIRVQEGVVVLSLS